MLTLPPTLPESNNDNLDPALKKDFMLIEDPSASRPDSDKQPETLPLPETDSPLPKRENPLNDKALPKTPESNKDNLLA